MNFTRPEASYQPNPKVHEANKHKPLKQGNFLKTLLLKHTTCAKIREQGLEAHESNSQISFGDLTHCCLHSQIRSHSFGCSHSEIALAPHAALRSGEAWQQKTIIPSQVLGFGPSKKKTYRITSWTRCHIISGQIKSPKQPSTHSLSTVSGLYPWLERSGGGCTDSACQKPCRYLAISKLQPSATSTSARP